MLLPTDSTSQPAIVDKVDPNQIIEVMRWCKAYALLADITSPLIRFNIGVYQIGKLLDPLKRHQVEVPVVLMQQAELAESAGAFVLHALTAASYAKTDIAEVLPRFFSDFTGQFNAKDCLRWIAKSIQQFFYAEYAPGKCYRRTRFDDLRLLRAVAESICQVMTLIPPQKRAQGIADAAEVLLKKAYKE